ncbi:MAG: hypothetical protein GY745_10600 [Actinomycetia bacterium]|nr:hypothetical protein [Actinomycetes bacterium]MCP4085485.1 hypothetical protein [Actinomycetes bacterium]
MAADSGPEVITDDEGLDDVIDSALKADRYALDTEFHRERTYFPKLALLQLAWEDELVLIDPLAIDVAPLADLLEGDGIAVLHAAAQDIEVLELATGTRPRVLFDTQIASGFIGMATPSLSNLHERLLDMHLPKGDRLTDWLQRPLTHDQLTYAASDVANLLEIHDILVEDLTGRGRLQWALDECEQFLNRARGRRPPEEAYLRIKEARNLKGKAAGVARMVAEWRELRAAEVDQPVRFVLSDLAVVGIAQSRPKTVEDLRRIRGVDDRHIRGDSGEELLLAVQAGTRLQIPKRANAQNELPRQLRPAISLIAAWIAQRARDLELDASLLATRADLEGLLRGDEGARLGEGWRQQLVGGPIGQVVAGEAALAFDPSGSLVLEERSGRSLS